MITSKIRSVTLRTWNTLVLLAQVGENGGVWMEPSQQLAILLLYPHSGNKYRFFPAKLLLELTQLAAGFLSPGLTSPIQQK